MGYRITPKFVSTFFGRMFNHPHAVLTEPMLRPELQDPGQFADALETVVAIHRRVAEHYFADGSIALACPPLRALLHIMRDAPLEGLGTEDPGFREWFTREHLLASNRYAARLRAKQATGLRLWRRNCDYVDKLLAKATYDEEAQRLGLRDRLRHARTTVERVKSPAYLQELIGTIGGEPALAR